MQDGLPGVMNDEEIAQIIQLAAEEDTTVGWLLPMAGDDATWKALTFDGETATIGLGGWTIEGPPPSTYQGDMALQRTATIQRIGEGWRLIEGSPCMDVRLNAGDIDRFSRRPADRERPKDAPIARSVLEVTPPPGEKARIALGARVSDDLSSTTVDVLVGEARCTHDQGRATSVGTPDIVETDESVTMFWTDASVTDQEDCLWRTVQLSSPLGDRILLNGSTYPAVEVPIVQGEGNYAPKLVEPLHLSAED